MRIRRKIGMIEPKVTAKARSAKSGEFVTMKYAKTHPSTTVVEHNKVPTKKK